MFILKKNLDADYVKPCTFREHLRLFHGMDTRQQANKLKNY